jgi:hypothetical protein
MLADFTASYAVVPQNPLVMPIHADGLGDIDFSLGGHALAGLANVPNWALAGLGPHRLPGPCSATNGRRKQAIIPLG